MRRISLRKLAVVAALGAAAAITGAALAAGGRSGQGGAVSLAGSFASSHGRLGDGPGMRRGGGFGILRGPGDELSAAASYLGLSESELLAQLRSGKTLAQIATATSGKSVDGLVDALVAAAKTKLDAAVTAGTLTAEQEQTILANLRTRITDLVNGMQFTGRWGARHGGPLVGPRWSHGSSI